MKKYAIGLDMGINNIGWSIYDLEKNKIVKKGVRLFSVSDSAKDRRSARASRRLKRRRINRFNDLKILLKSIDFPAENTIDSNLIETRCNGLKNIIEKQDITNILHYFCFNRGYIPFDEPDLGEKKEEVHLIDLNGKFPCEYYSQMLNNIGKYHGMNEVVNNSDNIQEIKAILQEQAKHYSCLSDEIIEKICEIISRKRQFWEGPGGGKNLTITPFGRFKSDEDVEKYLLNKTENNNYEKYLFEDLIGNCSILLEEKCAPRINYYAEYFNAIQSLMNLSFLDVDKISNQEFVACENKKCKLNKKGILSIIDYAIKNNKYGMLGTVSKIIGTKKENITGYSSNDNIFMNYIIIRKKFINHNFNISWLNDIDMYNKIAYYLTVVPGIIEFKNFVSSEIEYEFSDEEYQLFNEIKNNNKIDFKYHSLCEKMLRRSIEDMLKYEMNFSQVKIKENYEKEVKEYYKNNYTSKKSKMKLLDSKHIDNIVASPQVKKSLRQAMRILNAIILGQKEYPTVIAVESTKEMNGVEARKLIERDEKNKRELRESAVEQLPGKVNDKLIEKVMLYNETNGHCPYCGKPINFNDVISDKIQVEHILEKSQSFDNSFENKTVSCMKCNSDKNNRTPYQFLQPRGLFEEFEKRIKSYKISDKKLSNFLTKEDINRYSIRFFNRNLRDTAYATKEMINQIKLFNIYLQEDNKILTLSTPGQLTHQMRQRYNLEKDRDDVVHHAVDASIVAALTNTQLGKIIIESQNNSQFWTFNNDKLKTYFNYFNGFNLDDVIDEIRNIKKENICISNQVLKNGQGTFADSKIYQIIKKNDMYYKIEQIPDIYKYDCIKNSTLLKVLFDENNKKATLLCQENNQKLFNKLKQIYEKYGKSKNNPFVQYIIEKENLSDGENIDGIKYGIKNSDKENSPFVRTLRYYTVITNPYLFEKSNINKKNNTLLAYDSIKQLYTKVYYDLNKKEFVFFPVCKIFYNNKTKQINKNNSYYKILYNEILKDKKLQFVVDLYNGECIEITKKDNTIITDYYATYHKTTKCCVLKNGSYFSKTDRKITVYDTDILGNKKKRLTFEAY